MQNATYRQSGGILAFILIGIVLVALLGGGIYLSKQQGRIASQADTVVTDTTKADDTMPDATIDGSADTEDATEGTAQPQTADPKPSTPTAPTQDRSAATANQGVPATGPSNIAATGPSNIAATGPSNIAATGPSDVLVPMLAVSLLAGGAISYYRSSVAVRTQALKHGL